MRLAGKYAVLSVGAALACAAFNACTYDFDTLVAHTGSGGAGGISGAGGVGGAAGASGEGGSAGAGGADDGGNTGDSAGTGGAAGKGGTGGTAMDAGKDGSAGTDAGKGGTVDAASDRGPDAIVDVRSEPAFDCAAVMGTVYQAHCYYPSPAMTTWDNANTTACAAPSHLVTITSAGEQGVVAAILPNKDRWIGLHKDPGSPNMESSFKWVTGEPFGSYKSWDTYETGAPEPNYTGDCVRMAPTNNWGDTACTNLYAAVCEHE